MSYDVLIYSMTKSGTTTINKSLVDFGIEPIRFHNIHSIVQEQELKKSNKRWKIISLAREPIARNISSYFHFTVTNFPIWKKTHDTALFIDYFKREHRKYSVFHWFDFEIVKFLGIDIYSKLFDYEAGYTIYSNEKFDLLIIRTEDIDHSAKKALEEFLDINDLEIKTKNLGVDRSKESAHMYPKFIQEIKFSDEYLDEVYNSKYAQYFYTEDEINKFRKRWGK